MTFTNVVLPEHCKPTNVSSISSFQNKLLNQSNIRLIRDSMIVFYVLLLYLESRLEIFWSKKLLIKIIRYYKTLCTPEHHTNKILLSWQSQTAHTHRYHRLDDRTLSKWKAKSVTQQIKIALRMSYSTVSMKCWLSISVLQSHLQN